MRRQLIVVTLAASTVIVLAFVIPLGFLVQRTAEDRAIDAARADASAVVPTIVGTADAAAVQSAVASTRAGRELRLTVVMADGTAIGPAETGPRLVAALTSGTSSVGTVPGGAEVVLAVATGPDELAAVRVFVPDSALHRGRTGAWMALTAVGVALIVIAVAVADRLSRRVIRPVEDLARSAARLGAGELAARVTPSGPPEIRQLGATFNTLGAEVSGMLERERELIADLSHRLRTPLTHLSLRAESIDDDELRTQLIHDVTSLSGVVDGIIHEARGMTAAASGCDAADILRSRAAFWKIVALDQDRSWEVDTCEHAEVAVAAADLTAALDILIENVFRHTPDGSPVSLSCLARTGRVRLTVADAGGGFDIADAERGRSGGGSTGLGLDIVRQFAEHAGGSFEVTTSVLGGAEVAIELPHAI